MKLRVKRQKLSDLAAEEIKHWVMASNMQAGDLLLPERELMERLGVSKGTMREALKSLEVQGVIKVSAGAGGGAAVTAVSYEKSAELLSNYFFFEKLDAPEIYELRSIVEPEMAASVVGLLTEEHFQRLERSIAECCNDPEEGEDRRRQRIEELEFHNLLAQICPNPLLGFVCRFINKILVDLVVFKKMYLVKEMKIAQANHDAHSKLLEAYRREDVEAVRRLMQEHMEVCARHIIELEAVVKTRFLGETAQRPIVDLSRKKAR